MKLEQLEQIIEIDKQKSISKAAKALYMGQSTLSGSLTGLEEEIGVQLFERTFSGVVPTEAGREAVYLARQALDAVGRLQNLGQIQDGTTGTVTVLIGQAYSYLYNDILLRFKQRYPNAELRLFVRTHDEILSGMMEGIADIGLTPIVVNDVSMMTLAKLKGRECYVETFGKYEIKAFAGPESGYVNRTMIGKEELQQEQLLAGFEEWKTVIEKWIQPSQPVLVVADNESMKQMICNGDGIAIVPDLYENQEFHCSKGAVHAIALRDNHMDDLLGGLILRRRQSVLEQTTVQILKEILQE